MQNNDSSTEEPGIHIHFCIHFSGSVLCIYKGIPRWALIKKSQIKPFLAVMFLHGSIGTIGSVIFFRSHTNVTSLSFVLLFITLPAAEIGNRGDARMGIKK